MAQNLDQVLGTFDPNNVADIELEGHQRPANLLDSCQKGCRGSRGINSYLALYREFAPDLWRQRPYVLYQQQELQGDAVNKTFLRILPCRLTNQSCAFHGLCPQKSELFHIFRPQNIKKKRHEIVVIISKGSLSGVSYCCDR